MKRAIKIGAKVGTSNNKEFIEKINKPLPLKEAIEEVEIKEPIKEPEKESIKNPVEVKKEENKPKPVVNKPNLKNKDTKKKK